MTDGQHGTTRRQRQPAKRSISASGAGDGNNETLTLLLMTSRDPVPRMEQMGIEPAQRHHPSLEHHVPQTRMPL
jgi:hypothetical protein